MESAFPWDAEVLRGSVLVQWGTVPIAVPSNPGFSAEGEFIPQGHWQCLETSLIVATRGGETTGTWSVEALLPSILQHSQLPHYQP